MAKNNLEQSEQMEEFDLIFSVSHVKELLDEKLVDEVKKYIKMFFFRCNEKVFFFNGTAFVLYEIHDALKLIPDDLKLTDKVADNETKKFVTRKFCVKDYLKSTDFMENNYTPTINYSENRVFTKTETISGVKIKRKYLNMCKPLAIDIDRKIKNKELATKGLNAILDHIYNVICGGNEEMYNYHMNFFAHTFAGRKLRKCLFWSSEERTGKGVIMELFRNILGKRMHKTSSVEEILKYTKNFEGSLLVNFDEMPVDGTNFRSTSDSLKSLITEKTFICRDMYSSGYQQTNTFNIIISTNNNNAVLLTQQNKTRYICPDISTKRLGDEKYFSKLTNFTNNQDVQLKFYEYCIDLADETEDWNEDIMPSSETLKVKIIEGLPQIYKFLKSHFVCNKKGLNMKTKDFFHYYYSTTHDKTHENVLGKYLKKMGITPHRVNRKNDNSYYYVMTHEDMLDYFKSQNWIDENVDVIYNDNDECDEETNIKNDELVVSKRQYDDLQQKYESLLKKLDKLVTESDEDSEDEDIQKKRKEKITKQAKEMFS